jgi:hypothetical protein
MMPVHGFVFLILFFGLRPLHIGVDFFMHTRVNNCGKVGKSFSTIVDNLSVENLFHSDVIIHSVHRTLLFQRFEDSLELVESHVCNLSTMVEKVVDNSG